MLYLSTVCEAAICLLEYMDSGVKVTTIGAGYGMGVSVYTAQNMAKEGASYEDILKTFYSGVSIGESA